MDICITDFGRVLAGTTYSKEAWFFFSPQILALEVHSGKNFLQKMKGGGDHLKEKKCKWETLAFNWKNCNHEY